MTGIFELLESQPLIALLWAVVFGSLIGTVTGLVPGVHVNTVAPLVLALAVAGASGAPTDSAPAGSLWAALLITTVAVVHTIINVIPTLAAPLPEDDTALILLPIQRMARAGYATHALAVSILASWAAAVTAIFLLVAVLFLFPHHLPRLPHHITLYAIIAILILLLLRQSRPWHATGILLLSGTAGTLLLPRSFTGPLGGDGTVLLPAFAGLYGAPLLLLTLSEKTPPNASDPESHPDPAEPDAVPIPRPGRIASLLGTGCGLLVALFPGLTSATAGAFGRAIRTPRNDAEDVAMLSAVDTANVIGNTGALLVWGATRSGASAAALTAHPPIHATGAGLTAALALAGLLAAAALAGIATLRWGPRLVERLRRIPARKMAAGALALLALIVVLLAGLPGLLVALLLTPLGLLPHHWGAPRALLMGFLLVPYLASGLSEGPAL